MPRFAANLSMLYPELVGASSLKPEVVSGLDIMIIRELTGDIYFGEPRGRRESARGDREGYDTMLYSEPEIRRIAEVADRQMLDLQRAGVELGLRFDGERIDTGQRHLADVELE